jgi:arylformamidase
MANKQQHYKVQAAITDWSTAYTSSVNIPCVDDFFIKWPKESAAFIATHAKYSELDVRYGPQELNVYDLFYPATGDEGQPQQPVRGLFVFVHGGYWCHGDKSAHSPLAMGPLAHNYAVAMPNYSLCPNTTIPEITKEITLAISHMVERIQNVPIVLCGHSAGGHLVTRQLCLSPDNADESSSSSWQTNVLDRLKCVISISGVYDLRPIPRVIHNELVRLTEPDALTESPALLTPILGIPVICIVGSLEGPEFIRQNELLPSIWRGMGVATTAIMVDGKHHFDVIDDVMDPHGIVGQFL